MTVLETPEPRALDPRFRDPTHPLEMDPTHPPTQADFNLKTAPTVFD